MADNELSSVYEVMEYKIELTLISLVSSFHALFVMQK